MRIGSLTTPLRLQSETLTAGGTQGERVAVWNDVASFYALVVPAKPVLRIEPYGRITHVVTTRRLKAPPFAVGQRLVYQQTALIIRHVTRMLDHKAFTVLYTEEARDVL